MSVSACQNQVQRYRDEIAKLQKKKADDAKRAADETKRAHKCFESAGKANSTSSSTSHLRNAQRHEKNAVRYQTNVAGFEKKIANEHKRLHDAEKKLNRAKEADERKRQQTADRAAREHEGRMKAIDGKLVQHEELHEVAIAAIQKLQNLPEQITVLFLAANPRDSQQLRLDEESRAISDEIRKSDHRDAVKFESRWAIRPLDVLQAMNETRPTIIHFSGHGSDQDEIVFQDNEGNSKFVSKEAIVSTMAANSGDLQLVFFNTCYSHGQAESVVAHIPAAIGMTTAIGDTAARIFAAKFYSAIGFGLSVSKAFAQAKAALMLESIPEDSTPELFITTGLDPHSFNLVLPKNSEK